MKKSGILIAITIREHIAKVIEDIRALQNHPFKAAARVIYKKCVAILQASGLCKWNKLQLF